ncbi:MAG TPA: tetratricopeptide repeat protein [Gemmatimonadaceae bacterium]|nr:tetratricopeptide repeat protein [Gemmatimonadaceae bacterium]
MPDPLELLEEGIRCEHSGALERAFERYQSAAELAEDPDVVSEALRRQAEIYRSRCEWENALETAHRSADVARRAKLPGRVAEALNAQASVYMSRGQFDTAAPLLGQILALTTDDRLRGIALQNLGTIAAQRGDLDAAEQRFAESGRCFERAHYARGQAFALINSAAVQLDRGHYERACELSREAVGRAREVNDMELIALATKNLAEACVGKGDLAKAEDHASEALGFFKLVENSWRQVECYRLLGDICVRRGQCDAGVACYQHGLNLAQRIGAQGEIAKFAAAMGRAESETQGRIN